MQAKDLFQWMEKQPNGLPMSGEDYVSSRTMIFRKLEEALPSHLLEERGIKRKRGGAGFQEVEKKLKGVSRWRSGDEEAALAVSEEAKMVAAFVRRWKDQGYYDML